MQPSRAATTPQKSNSNKKTEKKNNNWIESLKNVKPKRQSVKVERAVCPT